MNVYRRLVFGILLGFFVSCNNESISSDSQRLIRENDSLQGVIDSLHILPFIDNTVFETRVGETYRMHLLGVLKNEIQIQQLLINGKAVDVSDTGLLSYDKYGAFLTFEPDTPGIYNFKANTSFQHWGEKVIPLSWPIEVLEEE